MKYIISESRLQDFILNYLDDSLRNIKIHRDTIDGEEYIWLGEDESPLFGLIEKDGHYGIGFDEQYVSSLSDLFGLSKEDSKEYIIKWVSSNMGIEVGFEFEPEMF